MALDDVELSQTTATGVRRMMVTSSQSDSWCWPQRARSTRLAKAARLRALEMIMVNSLLSDTIGDGK